MKFGRPFDISVNGEVVSIYRWGSQINYYTRSEITRSSYNRLAQVLLYTDKIVVDQNQVSFTLTPEALEFAPYQL